jgi:hypothetical protein
VQFPSPSAGVIALEIHKAGKLALTTLILRRLMYSFLELLMKINRLLISNIMIRCRVRLRTVQRESRYFGLLAGTAKHSGWAATALQCNTTAGTFKDTCRYLLDPVESWN